MKSRNLACAMAIAFALGITTANAVREKPVQTGVTSVADFVQMWQDRINDERLPVADPATWGLRNMSRFASFSADRLALAKKATSIEELEALLVTAPVANGTRLDALMAMQPGNVSLDGLGYTMAVVPKNDPTTTPTAYNDLVFTALNPCRVFDSRVSQGGLGPFINGTSRNIDFGPRVNYSFQGGSATSCGVPALIGAGQIAAVMFAVSSFSQTAAGYLTFWPASAPDPSASVVSMFFTAGPVQTAFVVTPTDLVANVFVKGIARGANTEVTIDIVGYFAKPAAAALDCTEVYAGTNLVIGAGGSSCASSPTCSPGYSAISHVSKWVGGGPPALVNPQADSASSGAPVCYTNPTGADASITLGTRCCRTAGR